LDLSEGTGMNLPHKSVIDFAVYDELYYWTERLSEGKASKS
jgi:hypothetical protein